MGVDSRLRGNDGAGLCGNDGVCCGGRERQPEYFIRPLILHRSGGSLADRCRQIRMRKQEII